MDLDSKENKELIFISKNKEIGNEDSKSNRVNRKSIKDKNLKTIYDGIKKINFFKEKDHDDYFKTITDIVKITNRSSLQCIAIRDYIISITNIYMLHGLYKDQLSYNIHINNLSKAIKYQLIPQDNILFKFGDIGDKYYFILRGSINILIPKWNQIKISKKEYLIILSKFHLYNEMDLLQEILERNENNLYMTLNDIEEFIHYEKQNNLKKLTKEINKPNYLKFRKKSKRISDMVLAKVEKSKNKIFNFINLGEDEDYSDQSYSGNIINSALNFASNKLLISNPKHINIKKPHEVTLKTTKDTRNKAVLKKNSKLKQNILHDYNNKNNITNDLDIILEDEADDNLKNDENTQKNYRHFDSFIVRKQTGVLSNHLIEKNIKMNDDNLKSNSKNLDNSEGIKILIYLDDKIELNESFDKKRKNSFLSKFKPILLNEKSKNQSFDSNENKKSFSREINNLRNSGNKSPSYLNTINEKKNDERKISVKPHDDDHKKIIRKIKRNLKSNILKGLQSSDSEGSDKEKKSTEKIIKPKLNNAEKFKKEKYNFTKKDKHLNFFDKFYKDHFENGIDVKNISAENYCKRLTIIDEKLREFDLENTDSDDDYLYDLFIISYLNIKTLKTGEIFGEVALKEENKKRTATVITSQDCHFGWNDKDYYDNILSDIKTKNIHKEVISLLNSPIFKNQGQIPFFKEIYFNLDRHFVVRSELIFKEGEEMKNIIILNEGEYILKIKKNLLEINDLIKKLGGSIKNEYNEMEEILECISPKGKIFFMNKDVNFSYINFFQNFKSYEEKNPYLKDFIKKYQLEKKKNIINRLNDIKKSKISIFKRGNLDDSKCFNQLKKSTNENFFFQKDSSELLDIQSSYSEKKNLRNTHYSPFLKFNNVSIKGLEFNEGRDTQFKTFQSNSGVNKNNYKNIDQSESVGLYNSESINKKENKNFLPITQVNFYNTEKDNSFLLYNKNMFKSSRNINDKLLNVYKNLDFENMKNSNSQKSLMEIDCNRAIKAKDFDVKRLSFKILKSKNDTNKQKVNLDNFYFEGGQNSKNDNNNNNNNNNDNIGVRSNIFGKIENEINEKNDLLNSVLFKKEYKKNKSKILEKINEKIKIHPKFLEKKENVIKNDFVKSDKDYENTKQKDFKFPIINTSAIRISGNTMSKFEITEFQKNTYKFKSVGPNKNNLLNNNLELSIFRFSNKK